MIPDPAMAYVRCPTCAGYMRRRMDVLIPEVVRVAAARGIDPLILTHRYRVAVHERHEAGLPL